MKPDSLKQLAESFPTVVHGLRSGKVSPVKAIFHKKLADQDQVRRIYEEVESRDERVELNMYIVGEEAEKDEDPEGAGNEAAEGNAS